MCFQFQYYLEKITMSAGSIDAFWEKYGGDCLDSDDDFPDFVLKKPSDSILGKRRLESKRNTPPALDLASPASPEYPPGSPSIISPTVYAELDAGSPKVPRCDDIILTASEETIDPRSTQEGDESECEPELVIDENSEVDLVEIKSEGDIGEITDSQVLAAAEGLSQAINLTDDVKWIQKAESLFAGHHTDFDSTGTFFGELIIFIMYSLYI